MAFIPVPNVAQLEAVYSQAGQIVENTFYYQAPGSMDTGDVEELGAAWLGEWSTNLKAYIPSETTLINIKVTDLTTAVSPVVNYSTGLPIIGTRGGGLLPTNVSLAFTRRTALRGRSYRGRIYWPGLIEADVTVNVVAPTFVSTVIAGLQNMNAVTTSLGVWESVVVSRWSEGNPRGTGVFTPIVNWTCDGIVDSQRRRLTGRGA